MTTKRTAPAPMPAEYNAREQSLWTQFQAVYVEVGHLQEKVRVLERTVAGLARDNRELRYALEHVLANTGCPPVDLAGFTDSEVSAGRAGVPATAPTADQVARKKGGAE